MGRLRKGSGIALGGTLGALGLQGHPRGSGRVSLHKEAPFCSRLFFCGFYGVFLKVPLTTSAAGRRLRDPGLNQGSGQQVVFTNTGRTLQAKAV
jgi:hypothetical protein